MRKLFFLAIAASLLVMACQTKPAEAPDFVRVADGHFVRDGKPYYYVGTNFWYGAILGSEGQGGDRQRLARELDEMKRLGIDNLRILVGSDGERGFKTKVEPTLQITPGVYNDTILAGLDYLLMEMGKRQMVAVLYLNNSWEWSGGYGFYLEHAGLGPQPRPDDAGYPAFMEAMSKYASNERAHQLFYDYVRFILGRTNRYTGVKYTDDPAIMSWQIGNEPRAFSKEALPAFERWLSEASALIRSLDPNHLISIGSEGSWGCENDYDCYERICADPNIDYCNVHLWPYNWGWAKPDSLIEHLPRACANTKDYIDRHLAICDKLNKPLVMEEFGYPRDGFKFTLDTPTQGRDGYYRYVFSLVADNAEHGGKFAGCNFWGWGGFAKPRHEQWQVGDPYTNDPAQEAQGLNSVFASDTTTLNVIRQQVERMSKMDTDLFVLGGELSNSAVTSVDDIDEVMPRMKALGLNTVLVPAYWELMEPNEQQFDFSLIDRTIQQARQLDLKVVFLWFGAWKNSMSCYAPAWFKQDTRRFPRARTKDGKPLEIASCFSEQVFQADNSAFEAFVRHVSQTGSDVVSMIQVENEIGMLEDARDHSPLAEKIYQQGLPRELVSYLKSNEQTLHPWLKARLHAPSLTLDSPLSWTQVFGDDIHTDEIFMAYYYAKYVGRLCETARRYTQMPLYVNAAMNSRDRQPGQYPSAGPLAHLIDLWHCGAPQLLCLAPDIYDTGFKGWADQYALPNNRLFIPESRCCANSGARALYAFGEHQALGFSPFAIDQASEQETESITMAYSLLSQLHSFTPLLTPRASYGLLFDQTDQERIISAGDMVMTCRHYFTLPWDPRATDGSVWPEGGAVLLKLADNEFLLAGTGVVVTFASDYEHARAQQQVLGEDGFVAAGNPASDSNTSRSGQFQGIRKGIASVDEVTVDAQGLHYQRRLNGDQDHQGRHVRIACGEWKILHVKLYDYK